MHGIQNTSKICKKKFVPRPLQGNCTLTAPTFLESSQDKETIRASVRDNRSGQTTPVKSMTVYSVGVVSQILPFITLHPKSFGPLFSPCGPLLNSESSIIPTYSNMSRLLDHDHQRLHKERNDLPPGGKTRNPARNCNTFPPPRFRNTFETLSLDHIN